MGPLRQGDHIDATLICSMLDDMKPFRALGRRPNCFTAARRPARNEGDGTVVHRACRAGLGMVPSIPEISSKRDWCFRVKPWGFSPSWRLASVISKYHVGWAGWARCFVSAVLSLHQTKHFSSADGASTKGRARKNHGKLPDGGYHLHCQPEKSF